MAILKFEIVIDYKKKIEKLKKKVFLSNTKIKKSKVVRYLHPSEKELYYERCA